MLLSFTTCYYNNYMSLPPVTDHYYLLLLYLMNNAYFFRRWEGTTQNSNQESYILKNQLSQIQGRHARSQTCPLLVQVQACPCSPSGSGAILWASGWSRDM